MIVASSAGSCVFSRMVAAGAIARPSMTRRRRSTTDSCDRRVAGSGKNFSGSWRGAGDRHVQMMNSAHVKAHRAACGGKGEKKQAVGRSRGGRKTKFMRSQMLKGQSNHRISKIGLR